MLSMNATQGFLMNSLRPNDKLSCRAEQDGVILRFKKPEPKILAATRSTPAPCYTAFSISYEIEMT